MTPTAWPFLNVRKLIRRSFLGALMAAATSSCLAQAYPSRPITLVVAYPVGGDTDAAARIVAEKLGARLGQPVVVDNRPGAGGAIGNAFVAKAAADGYTLLFSPSALPTLQYVLKVSPSVAFDPVKDFTPISMVGEIPLVMVTATSTGMRSVADLVGRARSGQAMTYGSAGNGSPMHFGGEMFNSAAGLKIAHAPYKGVGPLVTDVLGGHVDFGYATPGAVAGHIRSGKMRGLAILARQRSALEAVAGLPTLLELGYKDVDVPAWIGLLGPRGLPQDILNTLNRHVDEIVKTPETTERLAQLGIASIGGPAATLGQQIQEDAVRFKRLTEKFSIQAD